LTHYFIVPIMKYMDNNGQTAVPEESVITPDGNVANPAPVNNTTIINNNPPKTRGKTGPIIATIFGLLLLVGGIVAGIGLVNQRQLLEQHAGGISCGGGTCANGASYGPDCSAPQSTCTQRAQEFCSGQNPPSVPASGGGPISCGTQPSTAPAPNCPAGSASNCSVTCVNGRTFSDACPGNGSFGSCSQWANEACATVGSTAPGGTSSGTGSTSGGTVYTPTAIRCVVQNPPQPDTLGQLCTCAVGETCQGTFIGKTSDGSNCFSAFPALTCLRPAGAPGVGGTTGPGLDCTGTTCNRGGSQSASCGTADVWVFNCPNGLDSAGKCLQNGSKVGQITSSSFKITDYTGGKTCGAIQVDMEPVGGASGIGGCGAVTYTMGGACTTVAVTPAPTNPPSVPGGPTAQCSATKAYDTSFNLLTSTQLAALQPGDHVRFAVTGTTSSGTFDKARFTINGVLRPDVITKVPATGEFYDEYVIPTGVTAFNVTSQIHHAGLNAWY
jgi:hypothetical protein